MYLLTTIPTQFDTLATGSAVPDGYANADWAGFTVVESLSNYEVKPHSRLNVVSSDAEGASVTAGTGIVMELNSFAFACVAYPPDGNFLVPVDCSLLVISESATPLFSISSVGPFAYTVDYEVFDSGKPANMTKVIPNQIGSVFYFDLVEGPSYATLLLDDVVMTQSNEACGY